MSAETALSAAERAIARLLNKADWFGPPGVYPLMAEQWEAEVKAVARAIVAALPASTESAETALSAESVIAYLRERLDRQVVAHGRYGSCWNARDARLALDIIEADLAVQRAALPASTESGGRLDMERLVPVLDEALRPYLALLRSPDDQNDKIIRGVAARVAARLGAASGGAPAALDVDVLAEALRFGVAWTGVPQPDEWLGVASKVAAEYQRLARSASEPEGSAHETFRLSERHIFAANAILDRPSADPDDDAAIVARAVLRLAANPSSSSEPEAPGLRPLAEFTEANAAAMLSRLHHGAEKFGETSWRDDLYLDEDNLARLQRAVDHLVAALHSGAGPDEAQKRAADVANQAFMFADPLRRRSEAPNPAGQPAGTTNP